jgi:uncharacterized membrane protein (DUF485 family)
MSTPDPAFELDRKRRIRRNVVLLSLMALTFYVSYIVLSVK